MKLVLEKDFFEVKLASLIADYDRETMSNLYQPIIGFTSFALYFTLWTEANNQKITSLSMHGQLFSRMQIDVATFVEARKNLEAVGLLKTFVAGQNGTHIYHYEVFAPKTPYSFFNDTLLFGLLIKAVGENEANRVKTIYNLDPSLDYGEDISASFNEVFHPEFDDPAFLKAAAYSPSTLGRLHNHVNSEFSYEVFFRELSEISQLSEEAFTKKDMKEVQRLALLYGVNEKDAADITSRNYNVELPKGKRFNFNQISSSMMSSQSFNYHSEKKVNKPNLISGDSALASKINLMETVSPRQYLSYLQDGTKPASPDLRLINDLSKDFNLPNSVLNAIIDFVLTVNHNVLSRPYCEKVAASLKRENIETTIDAMNYLNKVNQKTSSKKPIQKETIGKVEKKEQEEEINWQQLLDDIDEGGANGKA